MKERRCVVGGDCLQPVGCSAAGTELAVRGSRVKGEQIMSVSRMYQNQMQSCLTLLTWQNWSSWVFNLYRMNLSSLDGQFVSIWQNQWGLRRARPGQVSGGNHRFPVKSSSVALVAAFLSQFTWKRCWSPLWMQSREWFMLAEGMSHLCREWKRVWASQRNCLHYERNPACSLLFPSFLSIGSWDAPVQGWNWEGNTFHLGAVFLLSLVRAGHQGWHSQWKRYTWEFPQRSFRLREPRSVFHLADQSS